MRKRVRYNFPFKIKLLILFNKFLSFFFSTCVLFCYLKFDFKTSANTKKGAPPNVRKLKKWSIKKDKKTCKTKKSEIKKEV